ncbi:spondin-2-like [Sycon ciliatum]|uniref:spondin-2-like n=1 Tax=Sycon ciliatum TaxID=27933 RepID=UPI0031F62A2C
MKMSSFAAVFLAALAIATGANAQVANITTGSNSCSCRSQCTATGTITYTVRLEFLWPASDYFLPVNPHWSRSVFATHSGCAVIFRNQVQPSEGIASLTARGEPTELQNETAAYSDRVRSFVIAPPVSTAAGNATGEVTADRYHPEMTALSMIAPSPSWFVGVDSVPLCTGDVWVQSAVYDIAPWNAGADGGRNYSSPDDTLSPFNVTRRIRKSSGTDVFNAVGDDTTPMARIFIDMKSQDTTNDDVVEPSTACNKCSGTCSAESYDWSINKPVTQTLLSSAGGVTFSTLAVVFSVVAAMLA